MRRAPAILILVGLAVLAACRAEGTVTAMVGDDAWVTLAPSPWQARLAKVDPSEIENPRPLTLARAGTEVVLATGSRAPGTRIPFVDGAHRCELRVDRLYEYDETSAPASLKRPRTQDLRTRTYRGIVVTAACPGGAVPGTDAAARGSRALWFVPWFALVVLLGALAARLIDRDRVGAGVGAVAAGLAAVLGAGLGAIGGRFALTSILGLAAGFVLGWIAGAAASTRRGVAIAGALAAVLAALGFAARYDPWSVYGPVMAAVTAAITMVVVLVIGVMLPSSAPTPRAGKRRGR